MSQSKTNARKCAVQALYQWQMSADTLNRIESYFVEEELLEEDGIVEAVVVRAETAFDVVDAVGGVVRMRSEDFADHCT